MNKINFNGEFNTYAVQINTNNTQYNSTNDNTYQINVFSHIIWKNHSVKVSVNVNECILMLRTISFNGYLKKNLIYEHNVHLSITVR